MAIKWISYFLDESELEDSELLLAIVIADHSDNDGASYPGVKTLARRLRKSLRQTQTLLGRLEAKGYVKIERQVGRGHLTTLRLQKVKPTAPIIELKGEADRTLSDKEKVKSGALKGEVQRQEKVKFSVEHYINHSLLNVNTEPGEKSAPEIQVEMVAGELAIQETEKAFSIRLDLPTRKLIAGAVPATLAYKWPAFIKGRAVGQLYRSDKEKLVKIGYALTDFQKDNQRELSNGINGNVYKSERDKQGDRVREQRAEEDELFRIGYEKREAEARRALSGDSQADDTAHNRLGEPVST